MIILQAFIGFSLIRPCKTLAHYFNFDLSSTTFDSANAGYMITGNANLDYLAYAVGTAGDINNDGYDDIIIGAHSKSSQRGAAYVIYGGPKSSLLDIDLATTTLDPLTTGFMMAGSAVPDRFGLWVSTAGDINSDGYSDIIIGAPWHNSYTGAVYVIYGGPKSSMSNRDFSLSTTILDPANTGFMVKGNGGQNQLGNSASTAGDINNDGYDDIIIGAPNKDSGRGVAYVIYGGPKSSMSNLDFSLSTTILDPANTGFVITGNSVNNKFGWSVGTAGDLNKDGYDDMIIGAYMKNSNRGAAYVIYGGPKSSASNIDLGTTTLDPATTGFIMTGGAASGYFGNTVSTAGDINNDGFDDIIVGAYGTSSSKGTAYVNYGGEKSSMQNWNFGSDTLDPTATGFVITGNAASDKFAFSVSRAGDLNQDGYNDIIIGASAKSAAYVVYGGPKSSMSNIDLSTRTLHPFVNGFMIKGSAASDELGTSVSTAGDINKDGYQDIIIGAYRMGSSKGAAYVIHTACSPCYNCPIHCNLCSSASSCTECVSPYILSESWCVSTCPKRTYSSNDKCQDCPVHCSTCTSQETCQTCDQGYTLSGNLCISPTSLHAEGSASQAISSATQAIGGVVSIGSSVIPMTALVSKIVQNTRYMNLTVTDELSEIYQTWNIELISWEVPNLLSRYDHFETTPTLFARYELDSPFLVNFWSILMTTLVGFATFIACFMLRKFYDRSEYKKGWIYSLLLKLLAGSFNFALIQVYTCLDDILFYLILDAKTNPFNTFFCWMSLFCAIGFLALGCFFIWLNLKKVREYQAIKQNKAALEDFNEKNTYWELFYSDFNDENFWSQFALAIFLIRSTLSSLIIAVFYEYPVMQTAYLIIIDGAIISFLYFEKPFAAFQSTLCQYYFETITLLVHICTFILSMQGTEQNPSEGLKNFLSTSIIYLNTALVSGSIGFMFIEIYKNIREKTKKRNKYESTEVQTIIQGNFILQSSNQNIETETAPLENLHLLSNFTQTGDSPRTRINLQRSHLSMNEDDSIFPNHETDDQIIEHRDQNSAPVMIRPRVRKVRINQ